MKVLVTGAAGFIGSHMVEALLDDGVHVAALDHRLAGKCLSREQLAKVDAFEHDIRDADAVAKASAGCSKIFHFAAMVGVVAYQTKSEQMTETEQLGLRNVCAAASDSGASVVYASSSAVYGEVAEGAVANEDREARPTSNYGAAKLENEQYLREQAASASLSGAALRIFNVYGPRQDERLVIPRFIAKAAAGEPIEIFGDGSHVRDFVFVKDVAAAAIAAAENLSAFEIYNCCSGEGISIAHLANEIASMTGSRSGVKFLDEPGLRRGIEVAHSVGSTARLDRLLKGERRTSLADGLRLTIESFGRGASA